MRNETVNGVTIHYAEAGRGRPVVLVHGFPLDWRMWEDQIAAFSDRFRVIAPDLPGFGRSASLEPFTIATQAETLRALLKKIDAVPCVLCGLSMGGYIALAYAKYCPTDLKALVLIDTRAEGDSSEGKINRNKAIDLVRASGSAAIAEQMLPKLLSNQTRQSKPLVAQKLREIMEHCPPKTIEHALAALRDREDYSDELASIAVPTLIIVGEDDVLTPPDLSRSMHARIPRSQLAVIPGAGHMTPMEQPDAVNREIEGFLSSLG